MRKLYLLLPILFLIYWSCEDERGCDSSEVELWGDCYSIKNTTVLSLGYNELTGSIPTEIGNLTNLRYLHLDRNQLTGEIPESICDLDNIWSNPNPVNEIIVSENKMRIPDHAHH
jgi:Leucine-rich repeat (LRR) protein